MKRWRNADDRKAFAERHFMHQRALEEIEAVERQIAEILEQHGIQTSTGTSPEDIGKAIASGLVANLLESDGGRAYKGRKHGGIFIFPGSSVYSKQPPKHIVAAEIGRPSHKHRRRQKERFRNRGRR